MARQARIKSNFGTYHIIQKGGTSRKLFETDQDRDKFVSIVQDSQRRNGFVLHGFCLLNDNGYDLIIETMGTDISNIMKSINISYSIYAKCDGKLFSDRYKSYQLEGPVELYESKRQLRTQKENLNPTSCYNKCYEAVDTSSLTDDYFADCDQCITCLDGATSKLKSIADVKGLDMEALLKDKDTRNGLIKAFRKHSTLSMKNLGILFGGISESSVSKIIKS
jgi:REP element-mobilizing transposase RayT